ncbi:MAG TPA: alpha/beta fold hydrolase [Thermotogota bacterium]|nr:alpha/beta fold hydrolase [Thermotogota bacterium]HPJ89019.1 alpha/beta fold hydrolase [Thermotogota bacterium]HPR95530.1 alpha/beta fold hydrolase [Thermotogota bacterium]
MKKNKEFILFAVFLGILPLLFLNQTFLISIFSQVLIFSIAALGLNILIGYAGQISIGHAAFMAVGAYLSAILTKNFNFPFIVTIILSGGLSGLFGIILGFPALRLKGFYLAIATMAFGVAIEKILAAWDYVGGYTGFVNVPNPDLFGLEVSSDLGKFYIIAVVTVALFLFASNMMKSKTGRALMAIRESEFAASSSGVNVAKYKLIAFVISAVYAGVAGALYAHTINYIAPTDFAMGISINLLAMIVVGGLASLSGNIIGSILMVAIPFLFSRVNVPMSIIFGIMLIVVVLFFPKGLGYAVHILQWKFFGRPWIWLKKKLRKNSFKEENAMFVKIGDMKIHFETGGDPKGTPIFMVHGNFASWRWFEPVLKRMSGTTYKGIAMDLPGFGDSTNPEREISIDNYAKELEKFINTFKVDKVNIIGHSLGGAVCMKYAINNGNKINKMLLVDPAPADGLITPEEYYPVLDSYKHNRGLLKTALGSMFPASDPDNLLEKITDDALMMDERAFTDNARALEVYNYIEDVKAFKFPVKFLVGENDALITERLLSNTTEAIEGSEIEVLKGAGHAVNVEDPDRFINIMTEFFGSDKQ